MDLTKLEKDLREATLDPKKAIEIAGELAIRYLGVAHEAADDLRVRVAQEKLKIKDASEKMSMSEAEARVEALPIFKEYLQAKHKVERIEEFIKIAKKHASISTGY